MNQAQIAVLEQLLARVKMRARSSPNEGERLWLHTHVVEQLEDVLEITALEDARPIPARTADPDSFTCMASKMTKAEAKRRK
jgi:hypothetical protein